MHVRTLAMGLGLLLVAPAFRAQDAETSEDSLVLVKDGVSVAPIVVFADAPPLTRQAADELAEYIERISGARPEVIDGTPDPLPEHAIWVGVQPVLEKIFPEQDFTFEHPEEILMAANADHVVIAGRDRWDPDHLVALERSLQKEHDYFQFEYGTINAVYTFLQDVLDVRWLWPGELGIDVVARDTIAVRPFQYRYHPVTRARGGVLTFSRYRNQSPYGIAKDWLRFQRLLLGSLEVEGGHDFAGWWNKYHADHPEYFALQPDGTRSGGEKPYPSARTIKLCHSNPEVQERCLAEIDEQLRKDPTKTVFNVSPNDGGYSGHCVCADCIAWDPPDGYKIHFQWQGLSQEYVALSDRQVKFGNIIARELKRRYPDRRLYAQLIPYGVWRPAPVREVPEDNLIILNCSNIFWNRDAQNRDGSSRADMYADWARVSELQGWRPNTGSPVGWFKGMPEVPFERVMDSFKFVLDQGCVGIFVDAVWEHWGTQAPLYYLMGQMLWHPDRDWRTMFDDYCHRAYGPAAEEMTAYWKLMEATRNRALDENLYLPVAYDDAFFARAYELLDAAARKVADAPSKYAARLDFARAGMDFTRIMIELHDPMERLLESDGKDAAAEKKALALWDDVKRISEEHPIAVNWMSHRPGIGRLHLHPAKLNRFATRVAEHKARAGNAPPTSDPGAELQSAGEAGWELVFSDEFERSALGEDWTVMRGEWRIVDGALRGSGTIVSSRGFPGGGTAAFQRMEIEAATDVEPTGGLGGDGQGDTRVCDLSSVLQYRFDESDEIPVSSGYFFQFGGYWNTQNQLRRDGARVVVDKQPATLIRPGERHRIVVENNRGEISMFVDGKNVIVYEESGSLVGDGRDRVGFCFDTAGKVFNVKVYVKRLSDGMDRDAADVY